MIRSLCLSLFISTAAVMPVRAESVEEAQKKVDELKNEKDNAKNGSWTRGSFGT